MQFLFIKQNQKKNKWPISITKRPAHFKSEMQTKFKPALTFWAVRIITSPELHILTYYYDWRSDKKGIACINYYNAYIIIPPTSFPQHSIRSSLYCIFRNGASLRLLEDLRSSRKPWLAKDLELRLSKYKSGRLGSTFYSRWVIPKQK